MVVVVGGVKLQKSSALTFIGRISATVIQIMAPNPRLKKNMYAMSRMSGRRSRPEV